jgi:uncharacterized membrane protein
MDMYSKRTLLRKITHQLIYIIIVASLVALSLQVISQEEIKCIDYHIYKTSEKSTEWRVTEVNLTLDFNKVHKKN